MTEERDFRTCGWAAASMSISSMFYCKKKKLRFLPADLGTGLCPCKYFVQRAKLEVPHGQTSKEGRETPPTLIGEPEEKK